jgi:hypothetical protein
VLSVTLHGVPIKGIGALAKLEHLQKFLFHHDKNDIADYANFFWCLQWLPRLQVSGLNFEIQLEPNKCLTEFAARAFERLKKHLPSALALSKLVLKKASEIPVGVVLPKLKTLYVIKPGPNFSLLGLLSLTELALVGLNQHQFEKILASIGHQLVSLAVSVWDTLYVDRVFKLCPKLQKFFITNLAGAFVGLNEPLKKRKSLLEFGFGVKCIRTGSRFQPDQLLQILQALPNLRVWQVKNYLFDEQECQLISEALEKNSILQNLVKFSNIVSEVDNLEDNGELEPVNKVLRSLIDHCPKLSAVKILELSNI